MKELKKEVNFTWKQFDQGCHNLAKQILNQEKRFYGIYGIPRGGLVVAVRLSHLLKLPIHMHNPIFSKASHEHTLICDDISDTGNTLKPYKEVGYKIATLHYRKSSKTEPNFFYSYITHNKWMNYPWEERI